MNEKHEKTVRDIEKVCNSLCAFLKEKNMRYGDSALSPVKVFSKSDNTSSIAIRLDDKISRIMNSDTLRKNDITDLTGYLILLMIANGWTDLTDQIN